MNVKHLLVVLIIVIILVCGTVMAYFYVANNIEDNLEFQTLALSKSCNISVPTSNSASSGSDNYGIYRYIDSEHNLNITSFNSQEGVTLSGAVQMASIRDTQQAGANAVVENGTTIYESADGVYSVFTGNDNTHDNVLITCSDKDLLLEVFNSITYGNASDNTTNTVVKGNDSDRYVQDEVGLFDTVTGRYVGGQFDGATKADVQQYYREMEYESGYTDAMRDVESSRNSYSSSGSSSSSSYDSGSGSEGGSVESYSEG